MNLRLVRRSRLGALVLAAACAWPAAASAAAVTVAWDANTESDLSGYRIYRATSSLLAVSTANAAADSYVTKTTVGVATTSLVSGLAAATTYYFRLTAFNASALESAFNVNGSGQDVEVSTLTPPVDVSSPAIPSNLAWTAVSTTTLTLSWTASTDNVGVAGYRLDVSPAAGFGSFVTGYSNRDLGNVTSVVISGLTASTTYYARLRAYDATGNTSANSTAVSTRTSTAADTTLPTVSITAPTAGATVSGTATTVSATAADNVGVVGVQFRLDGANLGSEDTSSPYSISWNTTLTANGSHTLSAVARDAAGNTRTSANVSVTIANDATAPSAPTSPILRSATSSTLTLDWTAATDNVAVAGYRLDLSVDSGFSSFVSGYSNRDMGNIVTSVLSGLAASTTYYARLRAYDEIGNASGNSATASARTLSATEPQLDITAPALGNVGQFTSWTGTVSVRAEVASVSGAPITLVQIFFCDVGQLLTCASGHTFSMSLSTTANVYEYVMPSTFTGLKVGDLHYRITVRDGNGNQAQTPDTVIALSNAIQAAPDAQGQVALPNPMPGGQATKVNFARLAPGRRPAQVLITQLAPLTAPSASGALIDTSWNSGRPAAAYSFTADGLPAVVFSEPVALTLAYPDLSADPLPAGAELRAFYHDGVQWRLLGGSLDLSRRIVTVETSHFSTFGLFAVSGAGILAAADDVKALEKFITPVPMDGFNDTATFGTGAHKVEIFDVKGRKVFSASAGGSALVWTGKDDSGKVVESGAYIARLTDAQGKKRYQTIVVAK